MEVSGITTHDHRSTSPGFKIAISRDVAAMPRLVDTIRAVASQLTLIDDTQPGHPDQDAHLVVVTEHVPPLPRALGSRIIVANAEETTIRRSMRSAIGAVISPDISVGDVRTVLTAAIGGYYPVPRHLAPLVATRLEAPKKQMLSERDRTILAHLASGGTMADLARELGCSERHARRHVHSLWNTMEVHGRAQGLVAAARRGFLEDIEHSSDQPSNEPRYDDH